MSHEENQALFNRELQKLKSKSLYEGESIFIVELYVFDMSEPTPFNSVEVPVIADDTHDAKEYAITFAENNIKPEVYGQYYEANTIQTLSEYEGLKTKKRITPSIDLP